MSAIPRTPHKKSRRTGRQDMKAYFKYVMQTYDINPKAKTSYVADAQRLLDPSIWELIAKDKDVSAAHTALLATPAESTDYNAVSYLLNRISYAYVIHTDRRVESEVIVYSSPHDQMASGDYLGAVAKADWIASLADISKLAAAIASYEEHDAESTDAESESEDAKSEQWANIQGISEGKPDPEGVIGQFLWYLSALKRYRCDLDTAHGFNLQGNDLFLASLNACGAWLSETVERGDIKYWVTHIVLLYDAYDTRDTSFALRRKAQDPYVRWDVSLDVAHGQAKPEPMTVVPFNGSHCPGRMTWVAFELAGDPSSYQALYNEPVAGFFKMSWQDTKSVFNEGQLFDIAHGYARPAAAQGKKVTPKPPALSEVKWLPGLARHWPEPRQRDGGRVISIPGETDGIQRVKETVHLASVGQPLSRCGSPSQLIQVIFDAIGTHGRMVKHDVLHRDVSWFNILCNAWHHPATGNYLPDNYPCAEFVLTGERGQPGSLIVDLDHGALMKILSSATYEPRKERTGTPMFVAVELSSKSGVAYGSVTHPGLNRLVKKLQSVEDHKELFERAFPKYDGRFMPEFIAVVEKEKARDDDIIKTDPSTPHLPRHDVESFYWILLWALSRACPEGCDPYGGDIESSMLETFSKFVGDMLRHALDMEVYRRNFIFNFHDCASVLHPKLEHFAGLLRDMALYLSIPWHLYDEQMQKDHAHVAMQRLLILELHALCHEGAVFNVPFNTLQPRIAKDVTTDILYRQTQPTTTGLLPIWKVVALADRKSRTTRYQPPREVKRKSEDVAVTDNYFSHTQLKRVKERHASAAPAVVAPSAFPTSRHASPGDLIRMFFDDRLWFGIGSRQPEAERETNEVN